MSLLYVTLTHFATSRQPRSQVIQCRVTRVWGGVLSLSCTTISDKKKKQKLFPFLILGWNDVDVRLCHASCTWSGSADLLYTLREIREFLERNPREVVTIIFEDYLRNPRVLAEVFNEADISKLVLTSEHWREFEDWPTLSEMISLGRRLVVFNNVGMTGFPYSKRNMWNYVIENRYGSVSKNIHVSMAMSYPGFIII